MNKKKSKEVAPHQGRGGWNRGKRRTFTEEELKKIEHMAGLGLSIPQIAAIMKTTKNYFEDLMAQDKTLRNAIEEGRAKAIGIISGKAFEAAKIDVNAMKFWLGCRAGWSTEQKIDVKSSDGSMSPVDLSKLSTQELETFKTLILKAKKAE